MIYNKNYRIISLILSFIVSFCAFSSTSIPFYSGFDNNEAALLKDSSGLENNYVIVVKNKTLNANGNDSTISDRVIVALSDVKIKSSKGRLKLQRGDIAVFHANESYHIPKGEYFEIAIKRNHPKPIQPKVWYEPLKNKSLFENEDFKVFQERLNPGEDRPFHSHLERVVVRLNKVHLTDPRFYPNGKEGEGIQEPNTVKFAGPIEHVVRNLSKIPLFNIVLEFKP